MNIRAETAFAEAEPFKPEEPARLLREIPPGARYPIEALGPLREAAEAVHDITQAPPALGAQSALGVASLAAQALGDVETLGGSAPCSLFLLSIAQSGERKSAGDRLLMRPVFEYQRELGAAAADEFAAYRNRLDIWQAKRSAIVAAAKTKKGNADAAHADLSTLGLEPDAPLSSVIIASEPTFEGIAKNLVISRPALGVFSDEGGGFLGGHAMNSDNRLKTVAGLSGLWDGAPVNRTRAGDGVATFYGRRLACHLMAQPVAAAGLLGDPVANGQGFLARFLICEPPSAIGTRLRHGRDAASDAALARFSGRIGDMLRREPPLTQGTRNELEPPTLAMDADARALLQAFADEVEKAQAKGGDFEAVRPFASKAAEHAARMACVMTLYADPDARRMSAETLADAVTLAGFYLGEAKRLADSASISAETAEAETLRKWLCEKWPEPFISPSDIAQHGPSGMREAAKARRTLRFLESFGHVATADGGAEICGKRRREAFRVIRGVE